MTSKRSYEGYVEFDHRQSPGMTPEILARRGLPTNMGRGHFESAIVTCNHCQQGLILNPDRSRPREWCRGCDHYICDKCAAVLRQPGGRCLPFTALVEMMQEAEEKGKEIIIPERFK
jgi:hypothetical protein